MKTIWFAARALLARVLIASILLQLALPAWAQTRAWIDRDSIDANETVTLNIRTDGMAPPNYDPLQQDFSVSGRSSRTEIDSAGVHSLYAVALKPRRSGRLVIPSLRVGSARTQPLMLQVRAVSAPVPAGAGDDVFVESEPDDASPYVQQTVGWVVRLYSAAPLISGQLDQPAPDGALLQQVGEDVRYSREVAGRRYEVIERRYQLVPERSGALTIPGAIFEGRGTGGFFDELFGDRGGALNARARTQVLQVQAAPADAPQPWLPLRSLQLRYASTPRDLRTGSSGSLVIEAIADGATAAQMPELQLPPIEGTQVFADPVQADETFREGRPRVKLLRRFALVPARAGAVTLSGLRIDWWDVQAGAKRTASLPPISWNVGAADGSPAPLGTAQAGSDTTTAVNPTSPVAGVKRGWIWATLLFASLWLLTLLWAFHQRSHSMGRTAPAHRAGEEPAAPMARAQGMAALKRALDTGDLGDVAEALRTMATPPARDMDELLDRLADPRQREAVAALQRARWGDGDGVRARQALRNAFAQGPTWHAASKREAALLPPLYPE